MNLALEAASAEWPFPFAMLASSRATRIRIAITADGAVKLSYPKAASPEAALLFLRSRLDWVIATRARLAARTPPAATQSSSTFAPGATLPWRGELRALRVQPAVGTRPRLQVGPEAICLQWPRKAAAPTSADWRRLLMAEAAIELDDVMRREAYRLGLSYRQLRVQDPRSQWGSCHATGVITLSWRLAMAPPEVLRYVVIHELCHRRHPHHGPAFWKEVAAAMPEFAAARAWLKREGPALMRWV